MSQMGVSDDMMSYEDYMNGLTDSERESLDSLSIKGFLNVFRKEVTKLKKQKFFIEKKIFQLSQMIEKLEKLEA